MNQFFRSISLRLLLFNLLLVFLPVAGFLYLDIYEKQLLEAQERAMVQQGRVLAAALSGRGELEAGDVERMLARLSRRSEARLRVVDPQGNILADTSRRAPHGQAEPAPAAPPAGAGPVRRSALYRVGAFFYDLYRRFLPPEPAAEPRAAETPGRLDGKEVRAALAGRYGRATRVSPGQRSVTLSSALPVESAGRVVGAVVVSQSSYRILQDLYAIRLRIAEVCAVSLLAALVLSLFVSATIAGPIRRLRDEAEAIVDRQGRLRRRFRVLRRRDEIGDLARALETLTRRLEEHVRHLETFASDLAHELKNPLASIRASMEMLADVSDREERRRFQGVV
ncbi:MAG TPA: HAMP domain-containing protein, partial [Thermoanaerobaculia bacterium]|nr:HAMP domain-containing protein [Thermoanaerobaculia bacterium]